ncbi:uncharacterized protein LOC124722706 [Schistocerca piceifrons]|uniref:uncharacterized protein LOC124722706 n=1 Tax=Schistocerca piceifrons TaxID=274613 RepID=UPI001F5F0337|nr:uncharacterized protein LOC124722706 [Schistocerca piceifrons]
MPDKPEVNEFEAGSPGSVAALAARASDDSSRSTTIRFKSSWDHTAFVAARWCHQGTPGGADGRCTLAPSVPARQSRGPGPNIALAVAVAVIAPAHALRPGCVPWQPFTRGCFCCLASQMPLYGQEYNALHSHGSWPIVTSSVPLPYPLSSAASLHDKGAAFQGSGMRWRELVPAQHAT